MCQGWGGTLEFIYQGQGGTTLKIIYQGQGGTTLEITYQGQAPENLLAASPTS